MLAKDDFYVKIFSLCSKEGRIKEHNRITKTLLFSAPEPAIFDRLTRRGNIEIFGGYPPAYAFRPQGVCQILQATAKTNQTPITLYTYLTILRGMKLHICAV